MQERKTKQTLMDFIAREASLELHDEGAWFYAAYRYKAGAHNTSGAIDAPDAPVASNAPNAPGICLRADYDAVTDADGISRHLCGHDGHAAILAAFAKWVSDQKPRRNVFFLFQPGEESGEGGALCRRIFDRESIDAIYGFHNIPGHEAGTLLLRNGTFACASTGLCLTFTGQTAHAAYPENGRNPANAIARTVLAIEDHLKKPHAGMILSTVIGIDLGSSSYGVSASEGTLKLTVRGEYGREFDELLEFIKKTAAANAASAGLFLHIKEIERFPATENHPEAVATLAALDLPKRELEEPFRWSEDFGWYLQTHKGAMFGIGAGTDCPPLHDAAYEFPDQIIEPALKIYRALVS